MHLKAYACLLLASLGMVILCLDFLGGKGDGGAGACMVDNAYASSTTDL